MLRRNSDWMVVGLLAWLSAACASPPPDQVDPASDASIDGAGAQVDTIASDSAEKAEDSGQSQQDIAADGGATSDVEPGDVTQADLGPVGQPECLVDDDCAFLEDGNLCNGTLTCDADKKRCVLNTATVVLCDTSKDTVCATAQCNPTSGKCETQSSPDGTPCVDSDPCSVDSACSNGACKAANKASWCQCQEDKDCATAEDGNPCNGTLFCDKATFPWSCTVNPATIVTCDPSNDTACASNTCDSKTGKCAITAELAGTTCDDNNPCTVADGCDNGSCAGQDVCACQTDADCANQDDGNACNGTLFCDKTTAGKHACKVKAGSVPLCNQASEACDVDVCDPKTGACSVAAGPDGKPCTDGDQCTVGDVCGKGSCAPGTMVCACKKDADCVDKDDGNFCNGLLRCELSSHTCVDKADSVVVCDPKNDTFCSKNACAVATGKCAPTAVEDTVEVCKNDAKTGKKTCHREVKGAGGTKPTVLCDDGDPCTKNDACAQSKCVSGPDVCECKVDADCAKKDDGNLCNGTFVCDKSGALPKCAFDPKTTVTCSSANDTACTKNTCAPNTGQCAPVNVGDGTACDDGDKCTTGDNCNAGQCKGSGSCGVTFTEVYNKAFAGNGCGGCHFSYNSKSNTYNTLLSDSYCGGKLVVPGNPDKSTIVAKMVQGVSLSCGKKMPKNSPGVSAEAGKLLKDWITAGAKND